MFERDLEERNRKIIDALKQQTKTLCTDAETARAYLYKHGLVYDSDSNPVHDDTNSKYHPAIEIEHIPPVSEKWVVKIKSANPYYQPLVEPAPINNPDHSLNQLREPIKQWLEQNSTRFNMQIDRGEWGEYAEWFIIEFNEEAAAHEFIAMCNQVKEKSQ